MNWEDTKCFHEIVKLLPKEMLVDWLDQNSSNFMFISLVFLINILSQYEMI